MWRRYVFIQTSRSEASCECETSDSHSALRRIKKKQLLERFLLVVARQEVCRFCLTTSKGFVETIKSLVEKSANLIMKAGFVKGETKGMRIYRLREFTNEEDFPIFVQYGYHNDDFVTHMHEDFGVSDHFRGACYASCR